MYQLQRGVRRMVAWLAWLAAWHRTGRAPTTAPSVEATCLICGKPASVPVPPAPEAVIFLAVHRKCYMKHAPP